MATANLTSATAGKSWWLAIPTLFAIAFVAFALPPYLTFDPTRSRIPPPDIAAYYPLLVTHVIFASVAMLTGAAQIWTGVLRRNSALHRSLGRVYIFGGVLPAAVAGFVIGIMSPSGRW